MNSVAVFGEVVEESVEEIAEGASAVAARYTSERFFERREVFINEFPLLDIF